MTYIKLSQFPKILFAVLTIAVQQPIILAQTPPNPDPPENGAPDQRVDAASRAQTPPPPPDNGAPSQREGAASRGLCLGVKRLTALVPQVQNSPQSANSKLALGKTAAAHPSFWFYVPYSLTSAHPIEFMLRDEAGKDIYQATLKASETTPGVVGFQLPATEPPLEVGKRYHWFFSVSCNQEERVFVAGWVERVTLNPSLVTQLEQASPSEQVALYLKADLWHEALTTLAQLRRQNPEDAKLKTEWANLLQSIKLDAIAPEPLTAALTQNTVTITPSNF